MGAWGERIEDNDTVLDVIGTFAEQLKKSQCVKTATLKVRKEFSYLFEGTTELEIDDAAHARIGLALAQWRYGALEPELLDEVRADLAAFRGINSYTDTASREKRVRAFVAKLAKPNPKPRAFPKAPKRPPMPKPAAFEAGDCLALQLPHGGYRAALVLARDPGFEEEEFNVIAQLKWYGVQPPESEVFKSLSARHISIYSGPYRGVARVSVVLRITVEPARFGVERNPDYPSWHFISRRRFSRPLAWNSWDDLAAK